MQPFGYTGYRYDKVADTYFAQAREYVPGVGRFAGEDWIKGSIEQPFSLNQYGYCFGNPFELVDYDGKKPRAPLANPSNADRHRKPLGVINYKPRAPIAPLANPSNAKTPREYAENDVLQNKNGAPYVGVFYLNIESGAFGNGHAAMMLLRSDDTGDLYSFVGDANSPLTILWGYNDANVNYAYGIDVGESLKKKSDKYSFSINTGAGNKEQKDVYNRAIYFPITNESGKAMAQSAKDTILDINGIGRDEKDYNVLLNNCDINARMWMQAGGIPIETGGHIAPNNIYNYMIGEIDKYGDYYANVKYGDLKEIWDEIHKGKNCTTID